MALQLNDITAIINHATPVPASSDQMWCVWMQCDFELAVGGPSYIAAYAETDAIYGAWQGIFTTVLTTPQPWEVNVAPSAPGSAVGSADHRIPAGRKVHLGYRHSGNSHFFYINGLLVGSITVDIEAEVFTEGLLGNDRFSVVNSPIKFWDFKQWNQAKSFTILQSEMRNIGTVISTAGLYRYCPLVNNLNDTSGNGRHFSGAGNYEFVAQPALPVNIRPETALTLPFGLTAQITQQALEASWVSIPVYYKFVNTFGRDLVISIGHWSTLANPASGGYTPHSDGYVTEDLSNSNLYDGFIEGSATFPLANGHTMWFVFQDEAALSLPYSAATLNIKTLRGPEDAGQLGDAFIRCASFGGGPDLDEWDGPSGRPYIGLHAAFVDLAGSRYRGYKPLFMTGESGDVFNVSKRYLFADEGLSMPLGGTTVGGDFAYYWYLLDANFNIITQVPVASPTLPPVPNRVHIPTQVSWQIGNFAAGVKKYSTIDSNGVKTADVTLGAIGTVTAIALNWAGTHLLIALSTGAIRQWNIAGGVFDADFAAAVANHVVTDILVPDANTVLACYFKSTVTRAVFVRKYNAAGATVSTHTPTLAQPITSVDPRLGYGFKVANTYWLFNHYTTDQTDLRLIRHSDNVLLGTAVMSDVWKSDNAAADPPLPYASDCCPVVELIETLAAEGGESAGAGSEVCEVAPPHVGCWNPHSIEHTRVGLSGSDL